MRVGIAQVGEHGMTEPLQPCEATQDTGPAPEWYHAQIGIIANKLTSKDPSDLEQRHKLYR
jgi:hypothetical protein